MKKYHLSTAFALLFSISLHAQQALHLLGVAGKNDRVTAMIRTPDGGYLLAGMVNNDASLYRFGCDGALLDSIRYDLPTANSFEVFNDVVALPDGSFAAVGEATSTDGSIRHGIAMRVSATLALMKFDTFFVNGKSAAVKKIIRAANGDLVVAGVQAGEGLDFGDAFVSKLDVATMRPAASISVFSYGIDEVRGLSQTTSGNLLLSGYATFGNIFDINATLTNVAWVRAIQFANGSKIWENTHAEAFPNRFGRSYFETAIENPQTGNILAGGTFFNETDTLRALDPHFRLFDKDGNLLDQLTLPLAGAQNLNEIYGIASAPFTYAAVGDSGQVQSLTANFNFAFFAFVTDLAGKIYYLAHGSDPNLPLSIQAILPIKTDQNAVAGTFYFPPGQPNNQQILVAIPNFTVEIEQANNELFASVEPTGNYKYQWFFENQPLAGQTGATLATAADGKYQVVVTDELGCSTTAQITLSGAGQVEAPIFGLSSDTVCSNFPLNFLEILPDAEAYQWDFGDGLGGSQQPTPVKSYSKLGQYQLKLTAKTAPGQFFVSEVKINSHEPYFDLLDPKPDIYFILKNAAGAEIYRSQVVENTDQLPITIPCALLLSNQNYLFELWDFDLLDTDDQLGLVFLTNPTAGGTFNFGNLSIFFQAQAAAANYFFTKNVVVVEPYITQNDTGLVANMDQSGTFLYQWFKNGEAVPGATDKIFKGSFTHPDCLTVQVVGGGICNNMSQPFCTVAAGETGLFQQPKIYPVPCRAGDFLQIDFGENLTEVVDIQLVDNVGRRVGQWLAPQFLAGTFGLQIPAGLPAGVFFLNLRSADRQVLARRLVLLD